MANRTITLPSGQVITGEVAEKYGKVRMEEEESLDEYIVRLGGKITPPEEIEKPFVLRYGEKEDEVGEYYKGLDITPPTEEEKGDIRERIRSQMQSYIDAINKVYAGMITKEEEAGEERLGRTRALTSRAGLLGAPRGLAQMEETREYTRAEVKLIEEEKSLKIAAVLGKIDERAEEEIRFKRAEAAEASEQYITYLKESRGEARENVATLAGAGISLDRLKKAMREGGEEGEIYKQLLDETGWSELELDAKYQSSLPKDQQIDYSEVQFRGPNGNIWLKRIGFDPVTQEKREYDYDINLPWAEELVGMKSSFAPDGTLLLMPEEFDPNIPIMDQIIVAGKFAKPETAGLPEDVLDLRTKLRAEPTYKDAIEINTGYSSMRTGVDLDNAQGDLMIISGMARMLDPGSVVRPAEFRTVAEAQGVFQRLGIITKKWMKGDRLHPDVRKSFMDGADKLYVEKQKPFRDLVTTIYKPIAESKGIDINQVVESALLEPTAPIPAGIDDEEAKKILDEISRGETGVWQHVLTGERRTGTKPGAGWTKVGSMR